MPVARWGNSLVVRLPKALVEKLNLKPGDTLDIVEAQAAILIVQKADNRNAALSRMAERRWTLPEGFRFDRDDANAR